jgi:hypothetical protein
MPFKLHTDASDLQLGATITQRGKPIAFYSRKLNPAQRNYTTAEKELLSIVETLKEFRNILLGQKIQVFTDHKNLTMKNFNTQRVMRWRLVLEEYGVDVIWLKGEHNVAADALSRLTRLHHKNNNKSDAEALSRLPVLDATAHESMYTLYERAEMYGAEELAHDVFPLTYKIIDKAQRSNQPLLRAAGTNPHYKLKAFVGGGKCRKLLTYKGKIIIPKKLRQRVIEWYHTYLLHPGEKRTEETIRQHLHWRGMRKAVRDFVAKCPACQKQKKQKKKYGYLPPKEAETMPWEKLCVDLGGRRIIKKKRRKDLNLKALTMIDPATGWFEIVQIPDKRPMTIANLVEQVWLSRYPWPTEITYDRGNEFIGHDFKQNMKNEYGLKCRACTAKNPQANSVLERIHQVLANMIRTFELEEVYMDEEDPWAGILAAVAFACRATYHTTLKATPGQLVFGRDLIFNTKHVANWEFIKQNKQRMIAKNNRAENAKRIQYNYQRGEKVLLETKNPNKLGCHYSGPYAINEVHNNGTVTIKISLRKTRSGRETGATYERVNIRRIHPFKE